MDFARDADRFVERRLGVRVAAGESEGVAVESVVTWPGGAKSLYFRLAESQDKAMLSKVLATVAADAPLKGDADVGSLAYRGADPERVDEVFARMGFKGIRDRVPERSR